MFIPRQLLRQALLVAICWSPCGSLAHAQKLELPHTPLQDVRLGKPRNLRDTFHPWSPPQTLEAWKVEAERIRQQILVSNGLWPLPERTPLRATIHSRRDFEDYTIEKVFFASRPGLYVTGSLYRPKGATGKRPGILSAHGHWANGRFYDAGEKAALGQREQAAEDSEPASRSPLQARAVHLARMGCVVFFYDMIGYADNQPLQHRTGFADVQAGLYLQNIMGLQTWNSIRALDFLSGLPDVDPQRIGVTGASGGGTQTFVLCAVDPRPAVAFPAVMVSTNMQGGCVCENADYLRIGVNNIAFAALFAPKPLAMSGADDWTIDIESKGYPELQSVYALYGKRDQVLAQAYPQYKHNYNRVARKMMYAWFNRHLKLGFDQIPAEKAFERLTAKELSVFDAEHPVPQDALAPGKLRAQLTQQSVAQFEDLLAARFENYRRVVEPAAKVLLGGALPAPEALSATRNKQDLGEGRQAITGTVTHERGTQVPYLLLTPAEFNGQTLVWVHEQGRARLLDNGKPTAVAQQLVDAGFAVVAADWYLTGDFLAGDRKLPAVNATYSGYTWGYNRPVLAERVQDILAVVAGVRRVRAVEQVHIVGEGKAGVWALLAASIGGRAVDSARVDLQGFSFAKVDSLQDANFLAGALKYGDLGGLAALAAPTPLVLAGSQDIPPRVLAPLKLAYKGSPERLRFHAGDWNSADLVKDILAR